MAQKSYKITALVDIAAVPENDPQFLLPEIAITEYHVIQTIRELGHEVTIVTVENDIIAVANQLREQNPDLVFNLTEEFAGDRRKDKNIAAMLELLEMPFTGTGSIGLTLCRDKGLSKQILSHHRIRVPGFMSFPLGKKTKPNKSIQFPMIVKPAFEDGSEGISNASVVNDIESLENRVGFVTEKWNQGAIVEEFIEGRELYVGVIGNKKLITLPIRECIFKDKTSEGPNLATYRVKWDKAYREKWNIEYGFAKLDEAITKKIYRICKRTYRLLHLRDYGRIDLRLTPDNKIIILEVNANPDIAYGEEVAEAAEKVGISYEQLIKQIISTALFRYKS
ncbi:MAG: ATP-grasp domain-containing protein [Sedimentisphaerales bacterium]|nr:ATP-grasp domain-containing protein [Sedimentisphaerales bacterium]